MPPKRAASATKISSGEKKARFSRPPQEPLSSQQNHEFDQAAFDDQVQADLEEVQTTSTRRGAVKTDGYDSDSSDDGEGVVLSRKPGTNEATDRDDDMFALTASNAPTTTDSPGSSKKPKEKYLALGDIEGQEFGAGDDGSGLESLTDDDEFEDEDTRERKAKEGMGYEISSFNMKAEMEEGKFAEDGTYHRSFDPHGLHDKWMEGIDEREMRKARRVKKKMEERERSLQQNNAANSAEEVSKELVCLLEKGETVLEALQRIGRDSKHKQSSSPNRLRKRRTSISQVDAPHLDATSPPTQFPPADQSPIELVTSLASTLMSLGNLDVYEETYESLLRTVRRSGIVPRDWEPPKPPEPEFEYRWSPSYLASTGAPSSSATYGPFSKAEILAWRSASYFGESGERIQLRKAGETDWGGWDVIPI